MTLGSARLAGSAHPPLPHTPREGGVWPIPSRKCEKGRRVSADVVPDGSAHGARICSRGNLPQHGDGEEGIAPRPPEKPRHDPGFAPTTSSLRCVVAVARR
jgi:hypothetical protein